MRKKHNVLIGERTAEALKINIGTAYPGSAEVTMDVRGRNLVSGLPMNITVSSNEMYEALHESVDSIVDAVHTVLEQTPPELAADISDRGIVMTGGGSLLYGLDKIIKDKTGINAVLAYDAVSCVAIGTGKYIEYETADSSEKGPWFFKWGRNKSTPSRSDTDRSESRRRSSANTRNTAERRQR